MKIDVLQCTVHDQWGSILWRDVEINWPECLDYCEVNCVPAWATVPAKQEPRARKPTRFEEAKTAMLEEIRENRISRDRLREMKGKKPIITRLMHAANLWQI